MFNPLEHKGIPLDEQLRNWRELNVEPIDPEPVDPYTRCRIITMNGIEVEAITVQPPVRPALPRPWRSSGSWPRSATSRASSRRW